MYFCIGNVSYRERIMTSIETIVSEAVATLRAGGTILYPTDTIWGIGCNAADAAAVDSIYAVKQRDHSKSMLILAREEWAVTDNDDVNVLLRSDRPTTVIVPCAMLTAMPSIAGNLPASDGTIGVRVPRHAFCQEIMSRLGYPLVSTSANFSGCPSPTSYEEIDATLMERVDYVVPNIIDFNNQSSVASRIVKIDMEGRITVIRD